MSGALADTSILSGASGASGYDIDYSSRWNVSDSPALKRDVTVAGNRRTSTWSAWVKIGWNTFTNDSSTIEPKYTLFCCGNSDGRWNVGIANVTTNSGHPVLTVSNRDSGGGQAFEVGTSQVFRDPSSWYHIVVVMDTEQATDSNRVKVYINGIRVTEWASGMSSGWPAQNYDSDCFRTADPIVRVRVGNGTTNSNTSTQYWDGYIAEVHVVDGQALTAADFGETDELTNEWKAIKYTGTYGTNGFYLNFDSSAGGSSFADSSSFAQTVTAVNGVWNSPAQKKIGDSSIKFDGGYLRLAVDSEYAVANNWTMECWVYCTQDPASGGGLNTYLWGAYDSDPDNAGFIMISHGTSGRLDFVIDNYGSYARADNVGLTQNAWHHVAFSRDGSTNYIFVDGVSKSVSNSGTDFSIDSYSTAPSIGAGDHSGTPGGYLMQGYFDEIRFSKVARYTATFTPSTTAFTSDSDTVLLIQSNFSGTGLGTDSSGQGNNMGPENLLVTDQMIDTPQNSTGGNFCTLNPLDTGDNGSWNGVLYEGNLSLSGSSGLAHSRATFALDNVNGNYWEVRWGSATDCNAGISKLGNNNLTSSSKIGADSYPETGYKGSTGVIDTDGSTEATYATSVEGDVVAFAYKAGRLYVGKIASASAAPTWFNSGNPVAGTGYVNATVKTDPTEWTVALNNNHKINFGADSSFQGYETAQGNTDSNGNGDFWGTVPTGYLALCTNNLADPSIALPGEHFNSILYTGDGGTTQAQTGVGFQPDFVWGKAFVDSKPPWMFDVIRGTGELIESSSNGAESTHADMLNSFDADGFTHGNQSSIGANGSNYIAWNWKGGGAGVENTDGNITSTVSANTTAGFSIVKYTGTGNTSSTVGHGLSAAPEYIIIKNYDETQAWKVGSTWMSTGDPWNDYEYLELNTSGAMSNDNGLWRTAPTASVFHLWDGNSVNQSTKNMVAYCFHSVEGYLKVGRYTGNGNANGAFVYTGLEPKFLMVKNVGAGGGWAMMDRVRYPNNVVRNKLWANLNDGVVTAEDIVDFDSNGFKWRTADSSYNDNNNTYVYIAMAQNPFKYGRAV